MTEERMKSQALSKTYKTVNGRSEMRHFDASVSPVTGPILLQWESEFVAWFNSKLKSHIPVIILEAGLLQLFSSSSSSSN